MPVQGGVNYMKLRLRYAIQGMLLVLGVISLRVGAEVDVSKSPSGEIVNGGLSQADGQFPLELGLLIGIVIIALVVVARYRKAS